MKVIHIFYFFFPILCLLSSCTEKPKDHNYQSSPDLFSNYASTLTKADTIAVKQLVVQFMDYLIDGSSEQAAAMLYKPNLQDFWKEPILLNDEELHEISDFLKSQAIESYAIKHIVFSSPIKTDVKCTFVRKGSKGNIKQSLHFNPVNYLGGWRLCLKK